MATLADATADRRPSNELEARLWQNAMIREIKTKPGLYSQICEEHGDNADDWLDRHVRTKWNYGYGLPRPQRQPRHRNTDNVVQLHPDPDDEHDDEHDFDKVLARAIPGAEPSPTPPVVCADFGGLPVLHAGELTFVYGHPKAGKSWVTLAMAKQTVEAGGRVLMICWERVEGTRRRRHRITRHDHNAYNGWAVIPHTDAGKHLDRWIEWLDEAPFAVVVFDSLSSASVPTDGTNFAEWYWKNVAPFASPTRALVAIDHSRKRNERDVAKGPLGSATKMALLDAAYRITPGTPGKPITDTDLTLEGANEAWSPQKLQLHIREGIPAVINADDHTDDQLFHMVKQGTLTERDAVNKAIKAGVITSRSTFKRRYKEWLEEHQNPPTPK